MEAKGLAYGTALTAHESSHHHVLVQRLTKAGHVGIEHRLVGIHGLGELPRLHDADGASVLNLGRHRLHKDFGPSGAHSCDAPREQIHIHHLGMLCADIDVCNVQRVGLELRHYVHDEALPDVSRVEIKLHLGSNLGDVAVHIDVNQAATGELHEEECAAHKAEYLFHLFHRAWFQILRNDGITFFRYYGIP